MRFMTSITAASICLSMTNINTASADSACVKAAIRSHFELMEYCKAEFYSLGSRVPGRAIAFGNLSVESVNIAGTVLLSRCVRGQVSMIFTLDAA
ncbi:MAG: hypothetical protein ACI9KS_001184 [Sulfitobacter sp.]|jgi:hypothetical protein